MRPWAQKRRNPWVRERLRVNVDNPVRVRGSLCAELLRFSRKKRSNDRIDEGTSPHVSPMRRHLCAQWAPFLASDRWGMLRIVVPVRTSRNVRNGPVMRDQAARDGGVLSC